jgi:hypothetical protein
MLNIYYDNCIASPIELSCPSTSFLRYINTIMDNPLAKKVMIGSHFKPRRNIYVGKVGKDRSGFLSQDGQIKFDGYHIIDNGILTSNFEVRGSCNF